MGPSRTGTAEGSAEPQPGFIRSMVPRNYSGSCCWVNITAQEARKQRATIPRLTSGLLLLHVQLIIAQQPSGIALVALRYRSAQTISQ
jgi:hypothetical protein